MVRPTCVVDGLLALQAPNFPDSLNERDVTAELRALRRFGVQLGRGLRLKALDEIYKIYIDIDKF